LNEFTTGFVSAGAGNAATFSGFFYFAGANGKVKIANNNSIGSTIEAANSPS
jgi:hypothetical protein